MNTHLNSCSYS